MTHLRYLSFSPQSFKGFCKNSSHSQTVSPVTVKDPIQRITIRHEQNALHIHKTIGDSDTQKHSHAQITNRVSIDLL